MANALTDILRAANKHPNSRVSKLIHTVEEEPSQKNIVLLLIELAEHAEYSIDFNISLKYYLELFERLGFNHDLVLNEAGLLLVNSSKIYSKRVDYVQSLVERQILTLSNADTEIQQQKLDQQRESQNENNNTPEKPKRGRKRALEIPSDPYEVELAPKKFKKLTEEKRFSVTKQATKPKLIQRNIEVEQHIHPAGWLHAAIYDFENEEDVDTKRNYKLFTYHVEHRYNTLVPDVNFRLHFKVKDYMDEQEEMDDEDACNTEDRSWPPLSEAYVQKYLRLENYVLQQSVKTNKRKYTEPDAITTQENNKEPKLSDNTTDALDNTTKLSTSKIDDSLSGNNDTGLGQSLLDDSNKTLEASHLEYSQINDTQTNLDQSTLPNAEKSLNATAKETENDSALGSSLLDQSNITEMNATAETNGNVESNKDTNDTTTDGQEVNDSALSSSVLDETKNTERNESVIGQETEVNSKESSELNSNILDKSKAIEANDTLNRQDDNNVSITQTEINLKESSEKSDSTGEMSTTENQEEAEKSAMEEVMDENGLVVKIGEISAIDASKVVSEDNAISDNNRHHSTSNENLEENLNRINLNNHTNDQQTATKDSTQLQVHLPINEDEGVCLLDSEERDFRLLSPIIKTVNIFPGVIRKDITILMDDELKKALDMRDGIMDHFGSETYKVPVIAEPIKHKLLFNILKLPEKQLRRKILFKLGPEMELFLKARCLKRSNPEPVTRVGRKFTALQWFSLNNTDMTGVYMTPPNSPGQCSDFCGFTDDEYDDSMTCSEFFGFTEEEQAILIAQSPNRLSRDSGVGVDVNNLTPDKEPLEIIFESNEADIENSKMIINIDQEPTETTESLLNKLPADIRDALTIELNNTEENITPAVGDVSTIEKSLEIQGESSQNITEIEENLCTEKSTEANDLQDTENTNPNGTQPTENLSIVDKNSENNTERPDLMCTESSIKNSESQDSENSNANNTQATENLSTDDQTEKILEQTTENSEVLKLSKSLGNSENADVKSPEDSNHFADCENHDSEDDILDLDTQGTKTKIQQWHEHLQPILAKSRERHHFDVFQLGTEIIDTVQSRRNSEDQLPSNESLSSYTPPSATFDNIMEDKDHSYVSRYFLSTLLLANQSNIEISINNKSSEKPSSWQDINLKLLSTKRHTVDIEDNIGMIDNKSKINNDSKAKLKTNQRLNKDNMMEYTEDDNEEDEPLVNLQNIKRSVKKSSLKRSNNTATSTPLMKKKSSLVTIQSVEIIPAQQTPLNMIPGTSQQAISQESYQINLNEVRTLQPIEKVQKRNDDLDSGIFSIDDVSTS